jgi:putative flippase GtrA
VRWFVVQTSGLLLNLGLVYLFVDGAGLDELVGQAVTIVIVTLVTFFANRAWTFRGHADAVLAEAPAER